MIQDHDKVLGECVSIHTSTSMYIYRDTQKDVRKYKTKSRWNRIQIIRSLDCKLHSAFKIRIMSLINVAVAVHYSVYSCKIFFQ